MNGQGLTDRLLSLSCFEGLRLLRQYADKHPELDSANLTDLIIEVEADAKSLDIEAALILHQSVDKNCPLDGEVFYQQCIKAVVIHHQPIWAKSMRQGRSRFIDSLGRDDRDVFAAAGLLNTPPDMDIVSWWDETVGHARLSIDTEKMMQARAAEALSIKHEKQKLESLGLEDEPEWIGLDDNFAGYDVLSYEIEDGTVRTKMIEVKSTIASPLRFYLSRNEWNTAEEVGSSYQFHVWDMAGDPPRLFEFSVDQVRPHIPQDNERGRWSNAEIPVGAL